MRPRNQTILAIDPGTRELGYAVIAGQRLVASDAVRLRLLPKDRRLKEARRLVRTLAATHAPGAIVVEKTYPHPVPWLDELHDVTVAARKIAKERGIRFATYSPQAVRQTVAGNGKAKKPEVAVAVAHRFPALRVFLEQDRRWKERLWRNRSDAIALGLHHQSVTKPPSRSRQSG